MENIDLGSKKSLFKWGAILVVFIILWAVFNFLAAFFASLFLVILVLRPGSSVPLLIALVLLCLCPFFLIINLKSVANTFAELSYYFLAAGVVLLLIDHFRSTAVEQEEPLE